MTDRDLLRGLCLDRVRLTRELAAALKDVPASDPRRQPKRRARRRKRRALRGALAQNAVLIVELIMKEFETELRRSA